MRRNLTVDGAEPSDDLANYKLIIAPRLYCVNEIVAENLRRCVEAGAVLCFTTGSGLVDEYNKAFSLPAPGPFAEMAGIRIGTYGWFGEPQAIRSMDADFPASVNEALHFGDEIELAGAKALACFDANWRKGLPAVTVHCYGKGKVVYVGGVLEGQSLSGLIDYLLKIAHVSEGITAPAGVRIFERRGAGKRLLFVMNFEATAQSMIMPGEWTDALSGGRCEQPLQVAPMDLRLLVQ